MNRIIRLTESDLARIVKRVISEEVKYALQGGIMLYGTTFKNLAGPGEVINGTGTGTAYGTSINKILAAKVEVTPEGTKLGLTAANLKITAPYDYGYVIPAVKATQANNYVGKKASWSKGGDVVKVNTTKLNADNPDAPYGQKITWGYSFTTPKKRYINTTGKFVQLFSVTFETNDSKKPIQTVQFGVGANAQFGAQNVAPAATTN